MHLAASLVSVWLLALGADGGFSAPPLERVEAFDASARLAEPVATLCVTSTLACLQVDAATLEAPDVGGCTLVTFLEADTAPPLISTVSPWIEWSGCLPWTEQPNGPPFIRAWHAADERLRRRWLALSRGPPARPVWLP